MSVTAQVELRFITKDGKKILQQKWMGMKLVSVDVNDPNQITHKEVIEEWRDVPLVMPNIPANIPGGITRIPDTSHSKNYRIACEHHAEAFFIPGTSLHDALANFQMAHRNKYVIAITELT